MMSVPYHQCDVCRQGTGVGGFLWWKHTEVLFLMVSNILIKWEARLLPESEGNGNGVRSLEENRKCKIVT